ncbi:MAG: hypothetical protein JW818_08605 [Pirellulales bacterium]|nr:hypothetical protein [Pirellulales bacterium]
MALLAVLGGLCLGGCNESSNAPKPPSNKQAAAAPTKNDEADRDNHQIVFSERSLTEADLQSLGEPYRMSRFEIRPPAKFRFIKYVPKTKSYLWVGPVRTNGTYAQFFVTIIDTPAHENNASLAKALNAVLGALKRDRTTWSQTPVEHGEVNGLPCVRCSCGGIVSNAAPAGLAGQERHGVIYLMARGNQSVQILFQDVAPDHAEWLKQASSAALTLRALPAGDASR